MSVTYICLLALVLTPLVANGRPAAESIESISTPRETRQYNMSPVPAAPWLMTPYGFQKQIFGRYPYLATSGTPAAQVQERFALALLLSLFGGGGGGGDGGDGGDDRNPWNFRPLANFQQQMANPQPFFWPLTTALG
ncbi:uncharacterized protein LOC124197277 [Daphnia pulex]|uniref:uncharacterized protein LOC124197277 n=1 Tax=Daphnia pulex TaxID=6669 RepID=UPI001EDF310A|nr:uncharacterized protein LOC124197277 [Daphnia pulex]